MYRTVQKRFIAVLLAAAVLTLGIPLSSEASSGELEMTVVSDIHYMKNQSGFEVIDPDNELYFHARDDCTQIYESPAVFREFLRQTAESSSDCVLICGDLIHMGAEHHAEVIKLLDDFKRTCSKPVYVIMGNHDVINGDMTTADFKRIYADYGFNQAIAVHDTTASYVVDLPGGEYRLIAIDSIVPMQGNDGVNEELVCWVEQQAQRAREDGKKVIASMHHCLLEHMKYHSLLLGRYICQNSEEVATRFARAGIQYIFTGHQHWSDISKYTTSDGYTIYDVLTQSLAVYPTAYRTVKFANDGVHFDSRRVESIDTSYLTAPYTQAQLEKLQNDFTGFTYGMLEAGVAGYMVRALNAIESKIASRLPENSAESQKAVHEAIDLIKEFIKYPIYSDGSGGQSVEDIGKQYSVNLPRLNLENLPALAAVFLSAVFAGDESFRSNDVRFDLCIKSAYICYKYIMQTVSESTRDALLGALFDIVKSDSLPQSLGDSLPNSALLLAAKDRGFALVVAMLTPVIESLSVDAAPADNCLVLPAYGQSEVTPEVSIKEKIIDVLTEIFEFFRRIVQALTGNFFVGTDAIPNV